MTPFHLNWPETEAKLRKTLDKEMARALASASTDNQKAEAAICGALQDAEVAIYKAVFEGLETGQDLELRARVYGKFLAKMAWMIGLNTRKPVELTVTLIEALGKSAAEFDSDRQNEGPKPVVVPGGWS